MSECKCEGKGYCPLLQIHTTSHLHKLCSSHHQTAARMARQIRNGSKSVREAAKQKRRERVAQRKARQNTLISWLPMLKHAEDRGIGDTAHRLCMRACKSPDASEPLQRLLAQCSCSRVDAITRLNQQYPY